MKANAPKRKVFQDALDLLAEDPVKNTPVPVNGLFLFRLRKYIRFRIIRSGCMRENAWKIWYRASGSMVC